jgi:tripartite-type tricarboxylate transporter receptor subunit TctC
VPLVSSFVNDPKKKEALELLSVRNNVGRPYLFPPKVPKDFLKALRAAFDEIMKDPKFLADAGRMHITPDPMTGKEVEVALKKAYSAPRDVVAVAVKLWAPAVSKKKKKKK